MKKIGSKKALSVKADLKINLQYFKNCVGFTAQNQDRQTFLCLCQRFIELLFLLTLFVSLSVLEF